MQYFTFQTPPTFYINYILYYIDSYCSAVHLHVLSKLYSVVVHCARIHADMSTFICMYGCSPSICMRYSHNNASS